MSSFSPTSEGFRLIFRRPAIPLAEIAWRSTFATAAWLLGIAFVLEYMGSLPVNALDRLLLGTQQPVLCLARFNAFFTEAHSDSPKRASCWPLGSRLLGWLWRRWGGLQVWLHCWTNSALHRDRDIE